MPSPTYLAAPGVSSHRLHDFRQGGPLHYYRKHVQGAEKDRDTGAYAFGRAVHALALEGEPAFLENFIRVPDEHLAPSGGMSTKAATREWKAAQTATPLTPNEIALAYVLASNIRFDLAASALLSRGRPEAERFSTHATGLPLKGCADWDAGDYGLDLKTCRTLDEFKADARRYGYIEQGAFYRRLFGWRHFYLIAVEREGANRVRAWKIKDSALDFADELNESALQELARRHAHDEWDDEAFQAA